MSSNSFGTLLTVTTFGESHGPAIGCVIDGCPPGLEISAGEFDHDLQRRATGKSRHTSARREADDVEILSGVYEGRTTGTPIALLIRNTDQRSKDYTAIASSSARAMPTTATGRSTASATRAVAAARPRAKPPCAWPPASSPRSGCSSAMA